jgi:hypothetical protein
MMRIIGRYESGNIDNVRRVAGDGIRDLSGIHGLSRVEVKEEKGQ